MVFLQPEYFKLFFLLGLLVPFWLFHFFSKRNARNRLGAAGPVRKISYLRSLWRDGAALSADQSVVSGSGLRAGPPSIHTGKTGRPA